MKDRESTEETQWMERLRAGDLNGLERLFRRHHRGIYGFFRRMGLRVEVSEELTQEVFLRILRYRRSFRPSAPFRAWMYRVARNVLADHSGQNGLQDPVAANPDARPGQEPLPLERLERREQRRRLRRALDRLTKEQREVLVLSRYQDLRYEEIGRLLGCSVGAVKLRVHRALGRLAELLVEPSQENADGTASGR